MNDYPNFLAIRGEGRNVGKTLLACNLLAKFGRTQDIIALKITYHQHKDFGDAKILFSDDVTTLMEETNYKSSKDTGRMLASGAHKAFLLQTNDEGLEAGLDKFFELVGTDTLVVCESGKILSTRRVGISFFVRQLNCQVCEIDMKKPHQNTDRIVTFTSNGFDLDLNSISIINNIWKLKE